MIDFCVRRVPRLDASNEAVTCVGYESYGSRGVYKYTGGNTMGREGERVRKREREWQSKKLYIPLPIALSLAHKYPKMEKVTENRIESRNTHIHKRP